MNLSLNKIGDRSETMIKQRIGMGVLHVNKIGVVTQDY